MDCSTCFSNTKYFHSLLRFATVVLQEAYTFPLLRGTLLRLNGNVFASFWASYKVYWWGYLHCCIFCCRRVDAYDTGFSCVFPTPRSVVIQVAELRTCLMDDALSCCIDEHMEGPGHDDDLKIISSLIANSARPSAARLRDLSRRHESGDLLKECCLRAVTFAANPFIPGITLSIRLGDAAKLVTVGEGKKIKAIQSSVDELLLEIFERLPQTVEDFEYMAGRGACTRMFEPKLTRLHESDESEELRGPMHMILSDPLQVEKFCKVPLVVDFLSREFRMGLPELSMHIGSVLPGLRGQEAAEGIVETLNDTWYVVENDLYPSSTILDAWVMTLCEGADINCASLSWFPAADFILTGVVGSPLEYYRVPVMRMALDFVVNVGMVAALSYCVLFHSTTGAPGDDGIIDREFSSAECICALLFIVVSIFNTLQTVVPGDEICSPSPYMVCC